MGRLTPGQAQNRNAPSSVICFANATFPPVGGRFTHPRTFPLEGGRFTHPRTFPLQGGRCPSAHTGADEGKRWKQTSLSPHQSRCARQLPPGEAKRWRALLLFRGARLPRRAPVPRFRLVILSGAKNPHPSSPCCSATCKDGRNGFFGPWPQNDGLERWFRGAPGSSRPTKKRGTVGASGKPRPTHTGAPGG